jgi:hypothetical protein
VKGAATNVHDPLNSVAPHNHWICKRCAIHGDGAFIHRVERSVEAVPILQENPKGGFTFRRGIPVFRGKPDAFQLAQVELERSGERLSFPENLSGFSR